MRRSVLFLSALLLAVLAAGPVAAEPHGGSPEASEIAPAAPAPSPPPEALLQGIRSVEVGYYHSCALLTNSQVRCWGYNSNGQLGNNDDDDATTAVVVRNGADTGPLRNVVQLALGDYHTCALLESRQVRCWGYGTYGQIGNGETDDVALPTVVENVAGTGPLQSAIRISAESDGACALLANRQLRCWGEDDYGQLGNGLPEAASDLPVVVKGVGGNGVLSDIAGLGGGYDNNCAWTRSGQGRCWGYQGDGALGNNSASNSPVPVVVRNAQNGLPLTGITQLSQGGYQGCARLTNGQARCWGDNTEGALGTGGTTDNRRAVTVRLPNGRALTGVVDIEAAAYATCALLSSGKVRCWGDDEYAQNGDGSVESPEFRKFPNLVHNTGNASGVLTNVRQLAGKSYHSCVTLTSGQARCWGYDSYGALGNGNDDTTPYPVRVQI
jgi:alpha-tubulin suppressor-like RCC1 family protein